MDTKRYPPFDPVRTLADARRTGILVASYRKSREDVARTWHAICLRERRPYVRIKLRRLWANVELDMEPVQHRLTPEARHAIEAAGRPVRTTHGPFVITPHRVNIGGVAPDAAPALAEQILGIALQDMQRGG